MKEITVVAAIFVVVLAASSASAQKLLFRYKTEAGNTVLVDRVDEAAMNRGYEVIDSRGRVQKRVPRRLTPEELEAARLARLAEEAAIRQRVREAEWDKQLLMRYSRVEDVEAAKARAVNQVEVRIDVLEGNLNTLHNQVEQERIRAARVERMSGKAPKDHDAKLQRLSVEIEQAQSDLAERKRERAIIEESYERDKNRFAVLLSRIGEIRR